MRPSKPFQLLLNILFVALLFSLLAITLIYYIRHQKHVTHLQSLQTQTQKLAGPDPHILNKSKQIFEAFRKKDFDGFEGLVAALEEDEVDKVLFDYSLSSRPHLINHIISRGCLRSLQILLETKSIDPNELFLLHLIIRDLKNHSKQIDFLNLLLAHDIDLNLLNLKGIPPLAHAITHNNIPALKFLIANQAEINVAFYQSDSILHFAVNAAKPSIEMIRELILGGANAFHRGRDGMTPFHLAIHSHPYNLDLINLFLDTHPASFDQDSYTTTLLNYPSSPSPVKSPSARTRYGYSPLHWAVLTCNPKLVQLLLNRGADPLRPDIDGIAPLKLAKNMRHLKITQILNKQN